MRLWHISNYADLSGLGGLRFPARWHNRGRPIIYTAEHPAGALTEFLVHIDHEDMPDNFRILTIDVPDAILPDTVPADLLRPGWTADTRLTRELGDAWLRRGASLLLRVPSVLVPEAFNMLINPAHPDAAGLRIVSTAKVPLDGRLSRI